MLMMSIHSHDNEHHYEAVKYGERIDFLPPKESTPPLNLLAGHFVPLKFLEGDFKNAFTDFTLDPLIAMCEMKIRHMITMEEYRDPEKRKHCRNSNVFPKIQRSPSNCIKL